MKAVVMEAREKEAAILLKDGTFRIVKGKYEVGETIDFHEKVRPRFRRLVAAAAAVAVLGTGGGILYDANYVVYAEVSLDVNPSVAYSVNKQNRVLGVRAVNEAAQEAVRLLEEGDIRFQPVSEAIERTMEIFENEGYLDTENEDYVLVNVSADDERLKGSLSKEVESGMDHAMEKDPTMEYRIDHSDRETAKRAAEKNMSTGRYAIWEQQGDGSKPEEYAKKPVREIMSGNPAKDGTQDQQLTETFGSAESESSKTQKETNPTETAEAQEKEPGRDQSAGIAENVPTKDQPVGTPANGIAEKEPAKDQPVGTPANEDAENGPAKDQPAGIAENGVAEKEPVKEQLSGTSASGIAEKEPAKDQPAGIAENGVVDNEPAMNQEPKTAEKQSSESLGAAARTEEPARNQETGELARENQQKQEISASAGKQEGQPSAAEGMVKDPGIGQPEKP